MNHRYCLSCFSAFFICIWSFSLIPFSAAASTPIAVYLSWVADPSSTMTIQWITDQNDTNNILFYQKEGEASWQLAKGFYFPLPQNEPFFVHRITLNNLSSASSYRFKIGEEHESVIYKFRTLDRNPNNPLRFIVGGDMYQGNIQILTDTHQQAAKKDPHFALVGGDIAYAYTDSKSKKKSTRHQRWIEWLKLWSNYMVTPSGYLIPIIPSIGNHDVQEHEEDSKKAIFFSSFFPFPGKEGRNVLDLGSFLSIIVLDSGHTRPIAEQTDWLSETLTQRHGHTHIFALYHIPAYPSVRKYEGDKHAAIRKYWVPLFEQYNLSAAFEHHDHAYKRTPLILKGKRDSSGILYLGDGGYGVSTPKIPRRGNSVWYLEKTANKRHFILVTLKGAQRTYQAIDTEGNIFDEYYHQGKRHEPLHLEPKINQHLLQNQESHR